MYAHHQMLVNPLCLANVYRALDNYIVVLPVLDGEYNQQLLMYKIKTIMMKQNDHIKEYVQNLIPEPTLSIKN